MISRLDTDVQSPLIIGVPTHQGSDGIAASQFLKAGSVITSVHPLWEHMANTPGKKEVVAGVEVNPAGLLPRDTSYYTYMESLDGSALK